MLAALLAAMTLSGCVTSSSGRPELKTRIPANCERLAKRVTPPTLKEGDDFRSFSFKLGGALNQANGRLDATRECAAKVRQLFGQ